MLAEHPQASWAYLHDIPGSRCDPDDGWPRPYKVLQGAHLWKELAGLSKPQRTNFNSPRTLKADSLNFQPCPSARTQDRYVVRELNIHGRIWTFTGVFDGHLGEYTVEHAAHHMPIIVGEFLSEAFKDNTSRPVTPAFIADLFSSAITSFDNAIAADVLDLFPGGMSAISALSDEKIRSVINDQWSGGENYKKVRLCMHGTTALVALVDPNHENLWVANLGDCQAILVSSTPSPDWKVEVLTTNHNGDNDAEVERVQREHPGEIDCVLERRVLGVIAPFRCIGDVPFKQPAEFTRRLLYNLYPGFQDTSAWEEFLIRNRTPPYISSRAEVTHRRLVGSSARFLVLASDGLADLCAAQGLRSVIRRWAHGLETSVGSGIKHIDNMALRLLWHALGEEEASVSRVLTLDMDGPWIDDTTIIVQTL